MDKYLHNALQTKNEDGYLLYHAPRYDRLLGLLHKYHTGDKSILDIGRSPFCKIANQSLKTQIDTLGFEADKKTATGVNYHFDLNDAQNSEKWRRDLPQYDIIIFSEVIEHLYTSPVRVLKFLKSLLKTEGLLIIQTPNAVALHKRLKMMFGKNPYHLIAENTGNPAHFREYTSAELAGYCRQVGFIIKEMSAENYFDYRYRNHAHGSSSETKIYGLLNTMYRLLPSSLRPGLCFVVQSAED